jgi:hypothetical protein
MSAQIDGRDEGRITRLAESLVSAERFRFRGDYASPREVGGNRLLASAMTG